MNRKQISELLDDILVEYVCDNCGMIKIISADNYDVVLDDTSRCCNNPSYWLI